MNLQSKQSLQSSLTQQNDAIPLSSAQKNRIVKDGHVNDR